MSDCDCNSGCGCTGFFIICFLLWFIFSFLEEIREYEHKIDKNNIALEKIQKKLDKILEEKEND